MDNEHFDAVIVGSGFGGSVMAYRLREAGMRVCLLERGDKYGPNSFPRSPVRMKKNFWDPSEGLYGLYNIWWFSGIDALVSSGLGGGSLIYANVLLRKPEKWFVRENIHKGGYEYWPVTRAELDPHYDAVESVLKPQKYPFGHAPYNETPKTIAFKEAAEKLGLEWELPNLAITFGNPGEVPVPGETIHDGLPNIHNHSRDTCRLCGECDIGCNFGSKNTLDYNYLSLADRAGAEIRHLCEVRSFEPRHGGGYTIHYVKHDRKAHEGKKLDTHDPTVVPPRTMTANQLVLSAGTFGSTYLLLKNRSAFPHISQLLGTRFSGNGDILALALKCSDSSSGTRIPRVIDCGYGPPITSAIRIPDALEQEDQDAEPSMWERGFYIEDAGYPEHLNWMLQLFDMPRSLWSWRSYAKRLLGQWLRRRPETDLGAEISNLLGTCELSAGLLPLLGMGRDIPDGRIFLNDGKLDCNWRKDRSNPYFNRVRQHMRELAETLGGTFLDNPSWYLSRLITVHPLGGCPMGRDEKEGVVDSYGRVFGYPGLYVADGSVMPGPVGPNPSLTIAALADRFADKLIDEHKGR